MAIFDRNDILFLIFGGLLFVSGFYGFVKVNQNPQVLREASSLASIIHITGDVQQKPYGAMSWFKANHKMPLYLWDEVFTQKGAEVEIEFDAGGTVVALDENSLIKIEKFGDEFQLDLIRGGLKVKKAPQNKNVKIQSWGKSLEIDRDSTKEDEFVSVSSLGIKKTKKAPERESPLVSLWEGVSKKKNLSAMLGEKLNLVETSEDISFSYTVTTPEGKVKSFQNQSSLQFSVLSEGPHQIQLTSVNGGPVEEEFIHDFDIEIKKSLQVPSELSNQKLSIHKKEKARLGVQKIADNNRQLKHESYDELIYEVFNQDKSKLVKSFKSKEQFQELTIKEPGTFYWRVRKESKTDSGETVSEVSTFEEIIIKKPLISEESVKKEQTQWASDSVTKGDLYLDWKLDGQIQGGYQVVLSKDAKGEEVVERINLSELDEKVQLNDLRVGKYYWALIPQSETRDIYSETPFYEVNLRSPPRVGNLPIKDKQVMKFMPGKNGRFHKITVPQIKNAEEYHIEVYLDPNLEKLIHRDITSNPESLWKSERSGEFHYRYRVKDKWGRMSSYSKTARLYFPISPTEDW